MPGAGRTEGAADEATSRRAHRRRSLHRLRAVRKRLPRTRPRAGGGPGALRGGELPHVRALRGRLPAGGRVDDRVRRAAAGACRPERRRLRIGWKTPCGHGGASAGSPTRTCRPKRSSRIIEAGRLTPTARNAQDVSYVVLRGAGKDEAEARAVRLFRRVLPLAKPRPCPQRGARTWTTGSSSRAPPVVVAVVAKSPGGRRAGRLEHGAHGRGARFGRAVQRVLRPRDAPFARAAPTARPRARAYRGDGPRDGPPGRAVPAHGAEGSGVRAPRRAPYFPALTSSSAISRSLNFWIFMDGVMGKSSTKNTRLGTL